MAELRRPHGRDGEGPTAPVDQESRDRQIGEIPKLLETKKESDDWLNQKTGCIGNRASPANWDS